MPTTCRAALLVLALGLLAAACGAGDDGTTSREPEPESEPTGAVVASELLYLGSGRDLSVGSGGPGLLVDDVDLAAYLSRILEPDDVEAATARIQGRLGGEDDLVGLAADVTAGCDEPTGAEVVRAGTDLEVVPTGVVDRDDVLCDAFAPAVAIVAIPRRELPADATILGQPLSAPVGMGEVQEVISVGDDPLGGTAEVRTAEDLDALLARWPEAAQRPRVDLEPISEGERRIAAAVSGCDPAGAEVVTSADELVLVARQVDNERGEAVECVQAVQVVVVVDVPAELTEDLTLTS